MSFNLSDVGDIFLELNSDGMYQSLRNLRFRKSLSCVPASRQKKVKFGRFTSWLPIYSKKSECKREKRKCVPTLFGGISRDEKPV